DQAALGCAGDISADLNDVVLEVPDPLAGLKLRETLPQHLAHALAMRRIPEMQDGVVPNGECRADRLEVAGCHSQHFAERHPGRVGHHDVTERIHPAATGASGHLLEFVRDTLTATGGD